MYTGYLDQNEELRFMPKQGDIIKLDFNPQAGHEQTGYRAAVILSNDFFNQILQKAFDIVFSLIEIQ